MIEKKWQKDKGLLDVEYSEYIWLRITRGHEVWRHNVNKAGGPHKLHAAGNTLRMAQTRMVGWMWHADFRTEGTD
jgi:hypothetical protein